MAHGVAGSVQRLQLHRPPDLDDVAGAEALVHARNLVLGVGMRQQLGAGGGDDGTVAADVVAMLVRVQHLGDLPALGLGPAEALLVVERINRHGLARLRANDQIIKISVGVACPDLLDDHGCLHSLSCGRSF